MRTGRFGHFKRAIGPDKEHVERFLRHHRGICLHGLGPLLLPPPHIQQHAVGRNIIPPGPHLTGLVQPLVDIGKSAQIRDHAAQGVVAAGRIFSQNHHFIARLHPLGFRFADGANQERVGIGHAHCCRGLAVGGRNLLLLAERLIGQILSGQIEVGVPERNSGTIPIDLASLDGGVDKAKHPILQRLDRTAIRPDRPSRWRRHARLPFNARRQLGGSHSWQCHRLKTTRFRGLIPTRSVGGARSLRQPIVGARPLSRSVGSRWRLKTGPGALPSPAKVEPGCTSFHGGGLSDCGSLGSRFEAVVECFHKPGMDRLRPPDPAGQLRNRRAVGKHRIGRIGIGLRLLILPQQKVLRERFLLHRCPILLGPFHHPAQIDIFPDKRLIVGWFTRIDHRPLHAKIAPHRLITNLIPISGVGIALRKLRALLHHGNQPGDDAVGHDLARERRVGAQLRISTSRHTPAKRQGGLRIHRILVTPISDVWYRLIAGRECATSARPWRNAARPPARRLGLRIGLGITPREGIRSGSKAILQHGQQRIPRHGMEIFDGKHFRLGAFRFFFKEWPVELGQVIAHRQPFAAPRLDEGGQTRLGGRFGGGVLGFLDMPGRSGGAFDNDCRQLIAAHRPLPDRIDAAPHQATRQHPHQGDHDFFAVVQKKSDGVFLTKADLGDFHTTT